MTVSESIIKWLGEFDMEGISTDIQKADVGYSLAKEPIRNTKAYLSGRKENTEHYTIRARLPSQTDADRIANNSFGENLSGWVEERNMREQFPLIDGASVQDIRVTTPFYMGATSTNDRIYEMTIAIKYVKEK